MILDVTSHLLWRTVAMALILVGLLLTSYGYVEIWWRERKMDELLLKNRAGHRSYSRCNIEKQVEMGFSLSWIEQFEQKYLIRTGLWNRVAWLRAWHLLAVSASCGLAVSYWMWMLFKIEGLAFNGFFLGCLLPLEAIQLWNVYHSYQMTCSLPSFFGVLLRWAQIQPDIYFCFGQLENSEMNPQLRKPFKRFLSESTSGLSKETAFDNLSNSFEGSLMNQFIKCIERVVDQRGDLPKLLQGFETEAYQVQVEVTKRKMTHVKYKILINGLSILSFVIIYFLLKTNQVVSDFYVHNTFGKLLLSVLSFMVVLSFLGGLRYDHE